MTVVKHRYPVSAEALYAAITDPDHLTERSEAAGHRNITVQREARGEGCWIKIERDIESEIPAIAKKVVNPVNHVVTEFEWQKSGDGWTGTYRVQVNPRIRVASKLSVRPAGDGSEYVDDFKATVDVPLIGGKIAGLVESETEKAIKIDCAWTASHLSK
ncbi:MAG: DUF2505 domain-containing protein [Sandaracinaceae bacterium]